MLASKLLDWAPLVASLQPAAAVAASLGPVVREIELLAVLAAPVASASSARPPAT